MSGTQKKTMMRTALLFAAMLLALVVSSGVALAVTKSCEAEVICFGTKRADTLNGNEGRNPMFGKGRGDTLNGFAQTDYLYGESGRDKLFGGPDNDELSGGSGNDALSGGEGLDNYYFGPSWGKDTITDSGSSDVILLFDYPRNSGPVLVSENLTIKLASGDGPEVSNASGTTTINWEGDFINDVYPGSGDDQITGNIYSNEIYAAYAKSQFGVAAGADNISTGRGDDYIEVNDGVGDDVVDCGETSNVTDDDLVLSDIGDQIADNCERIQH